MGVEFEVYVYDGPADGKFKWLTVYQGSSIIKAVYYMWWAKRNGWQCTAAYEKFSKLLVQECIDLANHSNVNGIIPQC
jgi:hypothetical protein